MRLVHFSDAHLGKTGFDRLTCRGLDRREVDVARTFRAMADMIVTIAPELIVIGGDLFDKAHPSNHAIVFAVSEFTRLRRALPDTIIVCPSGNHDIGKTSATGSVLPVLAQLGVYVADRHSERFDFPDRDLSVLAVPDSPGHIRPKIEPDPRRRFNVAVIHGEVEGMPRKGGSAEHEITRDDLGAESWSYVACGHYHVYRELAPNVFYSGSTDYTSSDIWGERREEIANGIAGKGFVERDLETGAHTFHPIPGVRPVFDIPPIDATGMTPEAISGVLAERLAAIPDGAIVRVVLDEISRDVGHALDQKMLKRESRRFLHLKLVENRPDPMARIREVTTERKKEIEALPDRVRRALTTRELPPDVDRGEFVAAGMALFGETANADVSILETQLSESLSLPLERAS